MSDTPAEPRWRILVTPRWISWHLFAVATVIGMMWLGDWQFRRAMAGNTLSWAYTFEWPIFAIFAVVFWVKTVRDELHPAADADGQADEVSLPDGIRRPAGGAPGAPGGSGSAEAGQQGADPGSASEIDTELAEYNAYLARLSSEVKGHGRWHGLR
ncbi:MAG TPA: hypothetical protein VF834_05600 [Streptosporangiaceae bacterium]